MRSDVMCCHVLLHWSEYSFPKAEVCRHALRPWELYPCLLDLNVPPHAFVLEMRTRCRNSCFCMYFGQKMSSVFIFSFASLRCIVPWFASGADVSRDLCSELVNAENHGTQSWDVR